MTPQPWTPPVPYPPLAIAARNALGCTLFGHSPVPALNAAGKLRQVCRHCGWPDLQHRPHLFTDKDHLDAE